MQGRILEGLVNFFESWSPLGGQKKMKTCIFDAIKTPPKSVITSRSDPRGPHNFVEKHPKIMALRNTTFHMSKDL
jgi:hypothetical protein